jgi:hypothetical protein
MSQQQETIDYQEITDEQIQAIYIFLSFNWETLSDEEKEYWKIIMEKIDPEFNNED